MEIKVISVDMGGGKSSCCIYEDVSPTLTCTHYGEPVIAYDNEECHPQNQGGVLSEMYTARKPEREH